MNKITSFFTLLTLLTSIASITFAMDPLDNQYNKLYQKKVKAANQYIEARDNLQDFKKANPTRNFPSLAIDPVELLIVNEVKKYLK